ncbi:MAG: hypothetical protein PHP99_07695 [Paludibacter sp.]|nr:hypothetical protein [Paludibacter sp.]
MRNKFIIYILFCLLLPVQSKAEWKERIVLETDKDIYLAGEKILFSVTTTDTLNRIADFSKVAYAELLSDAKSESQVTISISESLGNGYIEIPENLKTGYYRLVAYTRYMRNEGPGAFSRKLIAVVNPMTFDTENLTPTVIRNSALKQSAGSGFQIGTDKQKYSKRSTGNLQISNIPQDAQMVSASISRYDEITNPADSVFQEDTFKNDYVFLPEYEGQIINARLIDNNNNPISGKGKTDIYLSSPGEGPMIYKGKTDNHGNVFFVTEKFSLKSEIATVINTGKAENIKIDILSPYASEPVGKLPELLIDSVTLQSLLQSSVGMQAKKLFRIPSLKSDTLNLNSLYKPYKTYKLDEYTRFNTLEEVIVEFVTNVKFQKIENARKLSVISHETGTYTFGNTLVLLDNIPVFDHELLLNFNPLYIDEIKIFLGKYVFGGTYFDGIVSFNTYKRNYNGFKLDASTSIVNYPVLQSGSTTIETLTESTTMPEKNTPDFRHTLLWQPSLQTSGQKLISIPFNTSDYTGKFRIKVNVLTKKGELINRVDFIEVE